MIYRNITKTIFSSYFKFVSKRFYSSPNILRLHERGLVQDVFPPPNPNLQKLLVSPQCVYAGFDPTADSLHIGNLLVIVALLHCQRAGHQVIALIGGATAMIGDPSGKNSERSALPEETVNKNSETISENLLRIFQNHEQYIWEKNRDKSALPPDS